MQQRLYSLHHEECARVSLKRRAGCTARKICREIFIFERYEIVYKRKNLTGRCCIIRKQLIKK
jgi:hypothetical protein